MSIGLIDIARDVPAKRIVEAHEPSVGYTPQLFEYKSLTKHAALDGGQRFGRNRGMRQAREKDFAHFRKYPCLESFLKPVLLATEEATIEGLMGNQKSARRRYFTSPRFVLLRQII